MPAGMNPRSCPGPPTKNLSDDGTTESLSLPTKPLNVNGRITPQLNEECSVVPITVGECSSSSSSSTYPLPSSSPSTPNAIPRSNSTGKCQEHPPFNFAKPTSPGGPATSPTKCASHPIVGSYRSSTKHPFQSTPAVAECLRLVPASRAISGEQSSANGCVAHRRGSTSLSVASQSKKRYGPAMPSGGPIEGRTPPLAPGPRAAPRAWLASLAPAVRTNSL
mmetsp:Transcript_22654/g.47286  ORF Transcript_22654/g.47286 Transcript_22654/m.47286 type:complete len:221 (-) Transcript_22654:775-1437(-)